jgi:hypothetical protein
MEKKYYYFTPVRGFFRLAQICTVYNDAIKKNAELWKNTNGFSHVYVYDLNHNFIMEL